MPGNGMLEAAKDLSQIRLTRCFRAWKRSCVSARMVPSISTELGITLEAPGPVRPKTTGIWHLQDAKRSEQVCMGAWQHLSSLQALRGCSTTGGTGTCVEVRDADYSTVCWRCFP